MTEHKLHNLRLSMVTWCLGKLLRGGRSLRITPGELPAVVGRFRLNVSRAVAEFYNRWCQNEPRQLLSEGGAGLPNRNAGSCVCTLAGAADPDGLAAIEKVFGSVGTTVIEKVRRGLAFSELTLAAEARCVLALMTFGAVVWSAPKVQPTRAAGAPSGTGGQTRHGGNAKPPMGSLGRGAVPPREVNRLHSLLATHGVVSGDLPTPSSRPTTAAQSAPTSSLETTPAPRPRPAETVEPLGHSARQTELPPMPSSALQVPSAEPAPKASPAQPVDPLSQALADAVAIASGQSEDQLSDPYQLGVLDADSVDELDMPGLSVDLDSAPLGALGGLDAVADSADIMAQPSNVVGLIDPVASHRSPPDDEAAREVWDMRVKLSRSNHFTTLGLMPGAPLSFIRDRYVTLRAHFDPTVFDGVLDADGQADLVLIGQTLDRVVDELTDQEIRTRVEASAEGGMNEFQTQMYFDAERAWREAKRRADDRDYAGAIRLLDRAGELNGREPEYAVWRADMEWVRRVAVGRWDDDGRE